MVSRFVRRTSQFALSHGTVLGILCMAAMACSPLVAQTAPVLRPAVPAAKPAPAVSPAKPTADGNQEHLRVWGKWKIVVKNPDGTVASTTEFENSLFDKGLTAEELLEGSIVPNQWNIGLLSGVYNANGSSSGPCSTNTGFFCWIVANPNAAFAAGSTLCTIYGQTGGKCVSNNLTTSIVGSTFQLTGGFTAASTGLIGGVATAIVYCSTDPTTTLSPTTVTTTSPATCVTGTIANFRTFTQASTTSTPAFTPVAVTSGQIIQVTVALSFS
jgi:hypothetical protein